MAVFQKDLDHEDGPTLTFHKLKVDIEEPPSGGRIQLSMQVVKDDGEVAMPGATSGVLGTFDKLQAALGTAIGSPVHENHEKLRTSGAHHFVIETEPAKAGLLLAQLKTALKDRDFTPSHVLLLEAGGDQKLRAAVAKALKEGLDGNAILTTGVEESKFIDELAGKVLDAIAAERGAGPNP